MYELMAGFELTEIERSSVLSNNFSTSEKELKKPVAVYAIGSPLDGVGVHTNAC